MSVFHFSGVIPRGTLPIYISRKECVTFLDNIEKDIRACRDKSGKFLHIMSDSTGIDKKTYKIIFEELYVMNSNIDV